MASFISSTVTPATLANKAMDQTPRRAARASLPTLAIAGR